MSKTSYAHCLLQKKIPTGTKEQTSWIPIKFAKEGNVIKIKNEQDEWEGGWVVQLVGNLVTEEDLPDSHKGIKNHRKNTGDSLPKV